MVTPQEVTFPAGDGLQLHGQLFLPPKQAANGARARGGVLPRRFAAPDDARLALHVLLLQRLCDESVPGQFRLRSIERQLPQRHRLRHGISRGAELWRERRHEYNDVQGAGIYLRGRADVDPARIGAWGGSYGGYLVAMALARAGDLYKAGVDFHGVHNWATELNIPVTEPDYKIAFESSPMAFLKTWRAPVLLIQGDDDRSVQFNQTVVLAGALRKQGVEIRGTGDPRRGHDFLLHRSWKTTYEATARFLQQHLK